MNLDEPPKYHLRTTVLVYCIIVVCAVVIVKWILNVGSRPKDFPPGPPTVPILGNLHLVGVHSHMECLDIYHYSYLPKMAIDNSKSGLDNMVPYIASSLVPRQPSSFLQTPRSKIC